MRGEDVRQGGMFSYVSLEDRVPMTHPLRRVQALVEGILAAMHKEFSSRYSHTGRPSVAPEKLLRALLLQILYTVRSER
jgi:transposase